MKHTLVKHFTGAFGEKRTYDVETQSPLSGNSEMARGANNGFNFIPNDPRYEYLGNQAVRFIAGMLAVGGVRSVGIEPWRIVLTKTSAFEWKTIEVHLKRLLIDVYGYEEIFLMKA